MAATTRVRFPFRPRVERRRHRRARAEDVLAFFRQLTTLFNAGTPIHEALSIAAGQCQSDELQQTVHGVADNVAAGATLHEALAAHPKRFREAWVEAIRSGETSGQLGEVLAELCSRMDKAAQMRSKVVSALTYPAILAVVAVAAVIVMLVEVVPTFEQMFAQMDQELPAITTAIVDLSQFLRTRGLHLTLGVTALVVLFVNWARSRAGRPVVDSALLALPVVGDLGVQVNMQRFAANMCMSLRSGLSLLEALDGVKGAMGGNLVYREAVDTVRRQISQGERLADALEAAGGFPPFVVRMVAVGERSGTMPDVLAEVEAFFGQQVETSVTRLMSSLETVLVLFMGGTVALILSSVYLPMFSMASGVGG